MTPTRTISGHLPWANDALSDLPAIPKPPAWMCWARCQGSALALFFPEMGGGYATAAETCAACPVLGACRDWGDRVEAAGTGARGGQAHIFGYLGGETPAERQRRRRRNVMEGDTVKWVQVATELLAELGEWSEPVRVKVESDVDGVLELIFQRVELADDRRSPHV